MSEQPVFFRPDFFQLKDLSFETNEKSSGVSYSNLISRTTYELKNTPQGPGEDGRERHSVELTLTFVLSVPKLDMAIPGQPPKADDDLKTVALVEVTYFGMFTIEHATAPQLQFLLEAEAPKMLDPYVRQCANDMLTRSGFSPLVSPDVNYIQEFYNKQKQYMAATQK